MPTVRPLLVVLVLSLSACVVGRLGGGAGMPRAAVERLRSDVVLYLVEPDAAAGATAYEDSRWGRLGLRHALTIPGDQVLHSTIGFDDLSRHPHVDVGFSEAAAARLRAFTSVHVGRRLALMVDGDVLQVVTVMGEISDDMRIGVETLEEAKALESRLSAAPATSR